MENKRSIGDECPMCAGKLFDFGIDYPRLGCEKCKRVWVEINGMWVTEVRQVRVIKEPEIGDSPDDFLEEVKE